MQTRRQTLKQSAAVATLAAGTALLPTSVLAAFNTAAFEAKGIKDTLKALGINGDPVASTDVTLTLRRPYSASKPAAPGASRAR